MLHEVVEAGYEITPEDIDADIIIINTCAFIESARKEAVDNILDVAWLKENRHLKGIIVTGCLAERYREEIFEEMPEVDALLGVGSIHRIVDAVRAVEAQVKAQETAKKSLDAACKYRSFEDKNTVELGGDRVPKMAVYQDSLRRMEARAGQPYDWHMDLDITSPLRTAADIENAFAVKQKRADLDLVFSVCEARRNPWFNMVKTVDDHVEQVCRSEFTGRQQAPDVYDVNASIYVFKRDFLAENTDGMLWRGKIGISVMMDTGIIDIDSEHDYLLMEAIAQHLYAHYPEFNAVRENIRG